MDRRRNLRVTAVFPVRLWGVDAHDLPFSQMARVRNISSAGAVIQGMTRTVKPGEILEVQHAEQTARFRVVWVGIAGTRREKEIGVESLPDEPCIWGLRLERCVQFAGNG